MTCILAADAVGYSKLMSQDEANTLRVLAAHRAVIDGVIAFHDGRTYLGDKNVKTGDTCVFSIPEFKLAGHLKFAPGSRCLVTEGKHIGEVAVLSKIIARPGSHDSEALLAGPSGEFVTVAKYLFVVDEKF